MKNLQKPMLRIARTNLLKWAVCFVLVWMCRISSYAALSGTYTINAGIAASSSNYQSFEAAVSDMVSGTRSDGGPVNGSGISGTTIFNVATGTYTL